MAVSTHFPHGDKVLLADVDEGDALQLASFLELNGYTVRRATEITEALTHFSDFSPGVVVIDSSLPAKSWLTLIQAIRSYEVEKDSDYRSIILVTAGRFTNELQQKAIKAGAHEVVGRPVDGGTLLKRIAAHTGVY